MRINWVFTSAITLASMAGCVGIPPEGEPSPGSLEAAIVEGSQPDERVPLDDVVASNDATTAPESIGAGGFDARLASDELLDDESQPMLVDDVGDSPDPKRGTMSWRDSWDDIAHYYNRFASYVDLAARHAGNAAKYLKYVNRAFSYASRISRELTQIQTRNFPSINRAFEYGRQIGQRDGQLFLTNPRQGLIDVDWRGRYYGDELKAFNAGYTAGWTSTVRR